MKLCGRMSTRNIMKMNKTFYMRLFLIVAILAWCALIFIMSGETADVSGERSEGLSRKIINAVVSLLGLGNDDKEAAVQFFEHILRKMAHVFAYFVLAILSLLLAFTYKCKEYVRVLSVSVFCFIYAQSDEIHQIFVPGRAGSMTDVLIDMSGVFAGVLLVYLVVFLSSLKKKKTEILLAEQ